MSDSIQKPLLARRYGVYRVGRTCSITVFVVLWLTALCSAEDPALLTVAEKSDFRATARYADVVALVDRLVASSPLARRTTLGVSGEGRELPAIIIADPPVATPEEAAPLVNKGERLVVLAIGNIHAGEVDGKEGLPILAREMLTTEHPPLLKDLILIFAPIYNADGNEHVAKDNRPGQVGPEEGMGKRENAAGLDLNRDYVKLVAPETRSLIDFMNRWDPAIFIDAHTTNGCFHRYVITYEGPKCLAGDHRIIEYVRDTFLPKVDETMEKKYQVPGFWYGDFNADHTRWDSYPSFARYGTTYVGLRHRISVLSEGYSYAPYRTRILGTRDFVRAILEQAAANKDAIHKLLQTVDRDTIRAGEKPESADRIALRSKTIAAPQKVMAAGFVEEKVGDKTVPTETPHDYEVELWTRYEPTLSVTRPYAYVFSPALSRVVDTLRHHGVKLEELTTATEAPAEIYRVSKIDRAERVFQGVQTLTLDVESRTEKTTLPASSMVVRLNQPLGNLIVYLMEPQCEDGFATWDILGDAVREGADFPIMRLDAPLELSTRPMPDSH